MNSDIVYKKLMVAYLLLQEWKKAITAGMGSNATTRELLYMFDIYQSPGRSTGEYAAMNFVTPGTYTATHKSLLRKKLVTMRHDRSDKRVKLIALTPKGTAIVKANLEQFQRLINRIERDLGVASAESFVSVLELASGVMQSRLQEQKKPSKKK